MQTGVLRKGVERSARGHSGMFWFVLFKEARTSHEEVHSAFAICRRVHDLCEPKTHKFFSKLVQIRSGTLNANTMGLCKSRPHTQCSWRGEFCP